MNAIVDICKKCKCVTLTAEEAKFIKRREHSNRWAYPTGAGVFGLAGGWLIKNGDFSGIFYLIFAVFLFCIMDSKPPEYLAFYGVVTSKEIRYGKASSVRGAPPLAYDDTYPEKSKEFRYWAEYDFVTAEVDGVEIGGIDCSEREFRRIKEGDRIIIIVSTDKMRIKVYRK